MREQSRSSGKIQGHLAAIGGLLMLSACADPSVSKSADPTRAVTPVPSCVRRLPRKAPNGFARQIPEKDYWGLVVPSAQTDLSSVNSSTLDCAGDPVFAQPVFQGASVDPKAIDDGSITYGGGVNRLRVVWLRSHKADQGQAAGPLALLRVLDDYAEVYGVGSFRGEPEKSRFGLERLGGELVVTAISDGCAGAKSTDPCDTVLQVLRPVAGRLDVLAEVGLERVRQARDLEPGITGQLRFKLSSSPAFEKDGIHVMEEVSVTDEAGRTVRKAELERVFLLDRKSAHATADSLWTRLYEERIGGSAKAKTPAASDKTAPPAAEKAPATTTTKKQEFAPVSLE